MTFHTLAFFFFKQKTAYEMRISDWSSDVCSSDLSESPIPNPQSRPTTPVVGITGTGGAGKSSVTDELLNRFLASFPQMRIAVISVDPTRRRTGGALLGDRIRMNSLRSHSVYMRDRKSTRLNSSN